MKGKFLQFFTLMFAFVATVALFAKSSAMEIYSISPLQSPANGGVATYVYKVNDIYRSVGFVRPTPTTTAAAVWEGPDLDAVILPGLGGPNSLGDTGTHEVGHWVGIVGMAQDGSGTDNATLWVSALSDTYSVYALPSAPMTSGRANSVVSVNGTFFIGGNIFGAGNQSRACIWKWASPLQTSRTILPSLGGTNSVVQSLCDNENVPGLIKFMATGSSQTPTGEWHACEWTSTDNGATWAVNDISAELISTSNHGIALGNGFGRTGSAVWLSGVTLGFMDYVDDVDSARVWLPTPPNIDSYGDSVAADQFGVTVLGRLRIDGLDVPCAWKSSPWGKFSEPYTLSDLINGPAGAFFNPKELGIDRGIAGTSLVSEIGLPVIAIPTGMNGPDVAFLEPTQRGGSRTKLDETRVWKDDGKFWTVKRDTRSSTPITVSTITLLPSVDPLGTIHGVIRMRVGGTGNPVNRTATVTIQALNQAGQKVNIATFNVNGNWQSFMIPPIPTANFVHNDGEIYAGALTSFTSAEGRSMSFELFTVGP